MTTRHLKWIVACLALAPLGQGVFGEEVIVNFADYTAQEAQLSELRRQNIALEAENRTLRESSGEVERQGKQAELLAPQRNELRKVFDSLLESSYLKWTSTNGATVIAQWISADGAQVELKRTDGRTLKVDRSMLCAEDLGLLDLIGRLQPSAPAGGKENQP